MFRSVLRLEEGGYQVARLAPPPIEKKDRRAIDSVNLIAFKNWETRFIVVRTECRVSDAEQRELSKMRRRLSNHSQVIEWYWPSKAQEPEEKRIA